MSTDALTSLDACDPRRNATVSASAGSGKTWLLVSRMVRLLVDGAEPGQIVALTFTRKAAGEMHLRLNQRLYEMAIADESELKAQLEMIGCQISADSLSRASGLYERMMHNIYPIRIQTFHSFCQDILARFPLEADVPPGFELLEDTSLVRTQAWQLLFDEANNTGHTDHNSDNLPASLDVIMSVCNGPSNTRTALNSFLNLRNDWLAFTGDGDNATRRAAQQLAETLELDNQSVSISNTEGLSERSPERQDEATIESPIAETVSAFFSEQNVDDLIVFANLLRELQTKTSDKHAQGIDDVLGHLNNEHDTEASWRYRFDHILPCFLTQKGEPLVQGRKHSASMDRKLGADNSERFLLLHDSLAHALIDITEQIARRHCLHFNTAWYVVGSRYLQIFQRLKRELRLLDFNDLEWTCYRLLSDSDNAHWVQYKVDQRINHILIDEFQDTNPTQWQLLLPLLEEIAASHDGVLQQTGDRCRSVFLVGDEKQSIYSFRRANPELQAQASDWLAENLGAIAAPLDNSRRSSPAIIDCVNRVFEQDSVKAYMTNFSHHGTHLSDLSGRVQISELFALDDDNEDGAGDEEQAAVSFRNSLLQPLPDDTTTARHLEAAHIAAEVKRLCDGEHTIYDKDRQCTRPVEAGDIYLLMRHRRHMGVYEQALQEQGIPFISSKKGGLLDALEIQDICCLLEILVLPFSNLAFAQLLKSPIFDADDDDLILLASVHGSSHWTERLQHLADSDIQRLSPALRRAAQLLPRWHTFAEHLPVHDCLDRIFHEGEIIARYTAATPADIRHRVAGNCQLMLSLSLDVDSGRYPGITSFLQRLRHLQNEAETPPEEALVDSGDSRLTILTIHASKGLEAPIVFLADCNTPPRANKAYNSLVDWPADADRPERFQLQLPAGKTDSITNDLLEKKAQQQWREELNLLYVAITRAREQLYISGCQTNRNATTWYGLLDEGLKDYEEMTTDDGIRCRRHVFTGSTSSDDPAMTHSEDKRIQPDPSYESLEQQNSSLLTSLSEAFASGSLRPAKRYRVTAPSQATEQENGAVKTELNPAEEAIGHDARINEFKGDDFATWRGITIHRLLEQLCIDNTYPADHTSLSRVIDRLHTETEEQSPGYLYNLPDCIEEALATYNDATMDDIFRPAQPANAYNELPVMYRGDDGVAVYGIIDRVIRHPDRVVIIDYKTHSDDGTVTALTSLAESYRAQLEYYRQGIERLWPGIETEMGVLFTKRSRLVML